MATKTTPSATTTTTVNPGSNPGGYNFGGGSGSGIGIVPGGSTPNPAGGTSTADRAQKVWMPTDASGNISAPPTSFLDGSSGSIGSQGQFTIDQIVSYMDAHPDVASGWALFLENYFGYSPPSTAKGGFDPVSFETSFEKYLGEAASTPTHNATEYGRTLVTSGSGAQRNPDGSINPNAGPGANTYGSQRFYRGGVTEITLTPKDAVQVAGNAVAQQLLGRNLTQDEVGQITNRVQSEQYAKGNVDVQAAQLQQASYLEALGSAGGGGTTSGNAPAPAPAGATSQPSTPYAPGSFQSQAINAANVLANGLKASKGDPVGAENYYQTGSISKTADGAAIFKNDVQKGTALSQLPPVLAQYLRDLEGNKQLPAGVTAQMLAGVWIAEGRNANDPGFNPQGYGGFFGLPKSLATGSASTSGGGSGGGSVPQNAQQAEAATGLPTVGNAQQVGVGNVAQVGTPQNLNLPTGQAQILPPVVGVANAPLTPDEATSAFIQNQESGQFQAHNLLNVFDTIAKMAGNGVAAQGKPAA